MVKSVSVKRGKSKKMLPTPSTSNTSFQQSWIPNIQVPPPQPFLNTPGEMPIQWEEWKENFDMYIMAMGGGMLQDTRKTAILMCCLGREAQRRFMYHKKPVRLQDEMEYDFAVRVLDDMFGKKLNIVYERYRFYSREQREGENIDDFVNSLRVLAARCDFENTENLLDNAIRDQVMMKARDIEVQKKLWEKRNPTLQEATDLARSVEKSNKIVEVINKKLKSTELEVQAIEQRGQLSNKKFQPTGFKTSFQGNMQKKKSQCDRCGRDGHYGTSKDCPAWQFDCLKCGRKGHFARVCRTGKFTKKKSVNRLNECDVEEEEVECQGTQEQINTLFLQIGICERKQEPRVIMRVNGRDVEFLVDSGSWYSIMSFDDYAKKFQSELMPADISPGAYGGASVCILGYMNVECEYEGKRIWDKIYVSGKGGNLLGWKIQGSLGLILRPGSGNPVSLIANVELGSQTLKGEAFVSMLKDKFPEVCTEELGRYLGFKHKICLKQGVKPVIHKVRGVEERKRDCMKLELDALLEKGVITPIESSTWLFPVVMVPKPGNNKWRLCVDLQDLNSRIWVDRHPLPNVNRLLLTLEKSKWFTNIDLSSAYHQIELTEDCKHLTSFVTPFGAFRYERMPFGLASAASVFQRVMEDMFKNNKGVHCFQDDILVTGNTEEEHDLRVLEVMSILRKRGLTIQYKKCHFKENEVSYLGHTIDEKGVHPKQKHLLAIEQAQAPVDKDELRSFLGLAEYYSKFVENFASKTEPMRELLKSKVKFDWSNNCQESFLNIKRAMGSAKALTTFDVTSRSILYVDASLKGLGAALVQWQGGSERIIAFASRALKLHEMNYSTIERECLACWWATKHFRNFLWGAEFVIKTDHKPLTYIFTTQGTKNVSTRIVRWVLELQDFRFSVEYLPGKKNYIADYLSRSPPPNVEEELGAINCFESDLGDVPNKDKYSIITESEWKLEVQKDEIYQSLMQTLRKGIPSEDPVFSGFKSVWDELSISDWGIKRADKWVPPNSLRGRLVELGHEGHPGRTHTKRKVRALYWWPGMDSVLEDVVRDCTVCADSDKVLRMHKEPLQPVQYKEVPWCKLALDIIGPVPGLPYSKRFGLVLVDYHSKWIEYKFVSSVTTSVVVKFLNEVFHREGAPSELVTDNGVQFVSVQMRDFLTSWGVQHVRTSLYNPKSNGLVERVNRVIKGNIQLSLKAGLDWERTLLDYVWSHRTTSNSVTGVSPFQLLRGRVPNTRLAPAWQERSMEEGSSSAQGQDLQLYREKYSARYNSMKAVRTVSFKEGDLVKVLLPFRKNSSKFSSPLKIVRRMGKAVLLEDGKVWGLDKLAMFKPAPP